MASQEGETMKDILGKDNLVEYLKNFEDAGYTSPVDVTDEVIDALFAELAKTKPGVVVRLKRHMKAYRDRVAAAKVRDEATLAAERKKQADMEAAAAAAAAKANEKVENISVPSLPQGEAMSWDSLNKIVKEVSYLDGDTKPSEEHKMGTEGGEDIKWVNIPYKDLSNEQLLKLLCQCKLQYGRTAGVSESTRLWGTGSMQEPVLEFKNVDLHPAFVKPSPSYYQRSSIFKNQSNKTFHLNVSEELTVTGQTPVVAANVQLSHEQGSADQHKHSVFMCTANVVCPYARVNLTGFVRTSAAVCDGLRKALAGVAGKPYSQRYNALIKAAEAYGMLVPTSVDIGVRADFEYTGTADETISAATTKSAVKAAVKSVDRSVGNAAKAETHSVNAAKTIVQNMTCTVVGPTRTISKATLTDVAKEAGDINAYDTVTVHSVTTIFDLLPHETDAEKQLQGEVLDVLNWHKSWSIVGQEDKWCDVKPINFDGCQVWFESGINCVYCTDCKTQAEAMKLYNEWWCATVVSQWDGTKPKEIKSYYGGNWLAQSTVRANVDKWYALQLKHHGQS